MYFNDLKYWFDGAASHAPKTNNALESFNGSLKNHHSFFKKKNIAEFKVSLLQYLKDRSIEYTTDKRPFSSTIALIENLKEKGNNFHKSKMTHTVTKCGGGLAKFYIFAGDELIMKRR